ncbi:MAG: HisA/HisF-related TIM barrel protein [Pirellulales bacterium]
MPDKCDVYRLFAKMMPTMRARHVEPLGRPGLTPHYAGTYSERFGNRADDSPIPRLHSRLEDTRVRIIPVIDLMRSQVVRGIAGRRAEYRPIQSRLVAGSNAVDIAQAFLRLGLARLYVADLDAIGSGNAGDRADGRAAPDWDCYRALSDIGMELWIDAGLRDERAAEELARFEHRGRAIDGVVAGLETLGDPATLKRFVDVVGAERLVFSLDLRDGRLLSDAEAWRGVSPLDCGQIALACGVRRMIVLDVAAVGVEAGVPTLGLCEALRRHAPTLEIVSGGGVRGAEDLMRLADAGCDGALVASALHDGRLTADDLARFAASE